MTSVGPGQVLAYDWLHDGEPVGWVRWTITGRKYACRLVLTQSVPSRLDEVRAPMLAAWQVHLERFVASLNDVERPWPTERADALRTMYADRLVQPLGALDAGASGGSALRFERELNHPIEKVWRAITEPEQLAAWFPALVDMDLTPGAKLRFELVPQAQQRRDIPDAGMTSYGEVTVVEPPHVLEYTWADEILRWEVAPVEGGCRLVFTTVFDRETGPGEGAGWHVALEALEARLSGRGVDRLALFDRADTLEAEYARHL